MTGVVQSSDDFYVVFQGSAQQTVTPPASYTTTATNTATSKAIAMSIVFGG